MLTSGCARARTALSTTGNTSGGQPASTAFTATMRRVTTPMRGGSTASCSSASPSRVLEHGVDPLRGGRHERQAVAPAVPFEQRVQGLGVGVDELQETIGVDGGHARSGRVPRAPAARAVTCEDGGTVAGGWDAR